MTTSPAQAPASALTCPRCDRPATPSPEVQTCPGCQGAFTLRAGALLDPAVQPPVLDGKVPHVKVKAAGFVLMRMGVVDQHGVAEGPLDPIVGMVPLDKAGVAFGDIFTVAVWRRISVVPLVVSIVLLVPMMALLAYAALPKDPFLLVLGLPLDLLFAFVLYRTVVLKANLVRVVGSARTVRVRFDNPLWRRKKFHDELLRRAGISPSPIP
jgi:hypothetical protein